MFHIIFKELRISKNYSQQDIADLLGYSRAAISGYEIGRNQPSFEDLKRIADFFNVTTDYLLGHSVVGQPDFLPSVKLSTDDERLLDIFRKVNSKGKRKLLDEAGDILDHPKYSQVEIEKRQLHA